MKTLFVVIVGILAYNIIGKCFSIAIHIHACIHSIYIMFGPSSTIHYIKLNKLNIFYFRLSWISQEKKNEIKMRPLGDPNKLALQILWNRHQQPQNVFNLWLSRWKDDLRFLLSSKSKLSFFSCKRLEVHLENIMKTFPQVVAARFESSDNEVFENKLTIKRKSSISTWQLRSALLPCSVRRESESLFRYVLDTYTQHNVLEIIMFSVHFDCFHTRAKCTIWMIIWIA